MVTNPKPNDRIFLFDCESPIVDIYPNRPYVVFGVNALKV
jgi:hypothetical protein